MARSAPSSAPVVLRRTQRAPATPPRSSSTSQGTSRCPGAALRSNHCHAPPSSAAPRSSPAGVAPRHATRGHGAHSRARDPRPLAQRGHGIHARAREGDGPLWPRDGNTRLFRKLRKVSGPPGRRSTTIQHSAQCRADWATKAQRTSAPHAHALATPPSGPTGSKAEQPNSPSSCFRYDWQRYFYGHGGLSMRWTPARERLWRRRFRSAGVSPHIVEVLHEDNSHAGVYVNVCVYI